jgi:hypothetical protein
MVEFNVGQCKVLFSPKIKCELLCNSYWMNYDSFNEQEYKWTTYRFNVATSIHWFPLPIKQTNQKIPSQPPHVHTQN